MSPSEQALVAEAISRVGLSNPSADEVLLRACPDYHRDPEHTRRWHRLYAPVREAVGYGEGRTTPTPNPPAPVETEKSRARATMHRRCAPLIEASAAYLREDPHANNRTLWNHVVQTMGRPEIAYTTFCQTVGVEARRVAGCGHKLKLRPVRAFVRDYLTSHPRAMARDVLGAAHAAGVVIDSKFRTFRTLVGDVRKDLGIEWAERA